MTSTKTNDEQPKHPGGRPPKFATPEAMQAAIDAYFAACDPHVETYEYFDETKSGRQVLKKKKLITKQVPYTMSGLADALDMSRQSLVDYKKKDKFSDTIKKARRKVEVFVERLMLQSNGVVAGVIFNAKNNFGWVDKTEVDQTVREAKPLLGGTVGLPDPDETELPSDED